MWKYKNLFFTLLIIISTLKADSDDFAVTYSKDIYYNSENDTINIYNDPITDYLDKNIHLTSDYINKKNNKLVIDGNIQFIYNNKNIFADEIIKNENGVIEIKNINIISEDNWIEAEEVCKKGEYITLKNSIISSCSRKYPAWSLSFTKGTINSETKWMNMYNSVFYIYNIPVMYFPYFAYPLNNTRQSGLLIPKVGISNLDGITYSQSYFWAPRDDLDITITPEVRTSRGGGGNVEFNYALAPNSILNIRSYNFGYEKRFVSKYDLENNYTGMSSLYLDTNNLIFSDSKKYNDTIYIDLKKIYNYGYYDLSPYDEDNSDKVESNINFSISDKENVFYVLNNYSKTLSDRDYVQTIPSINYESFFKKLFGKYYVSKYAKYSRYSYKNTDANEFNIGLDSDFNLSFFKDYLTLTVNTKRDFDAVIFDGDVENKKLYQDARTFNSNFNIKLASNLIDVNKNYNHVLRPFVEVVVGNDFVQNGYYVNINEENSVCDNSYCNTIENNHIDDGFKMGLSQSIISKNRSNNINLNNIFYSYLSFDKKKIQYISNILSLNINNFKIYSELSYDNENRVLNIGKIGVKYNDRLFNINVSNLYENTTGKKFNNSDPSDINNQEIAYSIVANAQFKYSKYIDLFAYINYDIIVLKLNTARLGGNIYSFGCLGIGAFYERELISGTNKYKDSISLVLNIKPFGEATYEQVLN